MDFVYTSVFDTDYDSFVADLAPSEWLSTRFPALDGGVGERELVDVEALRCSPDRPDRRVDPASARARPSRPSRVKRSASSARINASASDAVRQTTASWSSMTIPARVFAAGARCSAAGTARRCGRTGNGATPSGISIRRLRRLLDDRT
jgi:hypothetical protein